jgi:methionyl-tRNA formyltransferase
MQTGEKIKTIAFLGAKNIGYECLKYLYGEKGKLNIKIACVLTNARGIKILNFCKKNKLMLIDDLSNFSKLPKVDIIISVQYDKILKKQHIVRAKQIAINLHLAPLPEYRGCNQFSFAILNNDKIFGTTLHKLEEGIDSGPITNCMI